MKRSIRETIRHIAEREGMTERQVLLEMQQVIDEGYGHPDPAVCAHWAAAPFDGKPSPAELLAYLAERLADETPR